MVGTVVLVSYARGTMPVPDIRAINIVLCVPTAVLGIVLLTKRLGHLLASQVRGYDTVSRLGGEEERSALAPVWGLS